MVQCNSKTVVFVILAIAVCTTNGFNLSPKPNLIIREPNLRTFIPKYESSYFGFTMVLRESSIIIGAPRAQSTLKSQRNINETGAIYKCNLSSGNCVPYIFDYNGNIQPGYNEDMYDNDFKERQWLGASMDGGPKDTEKLVVCAPRLTSAISRTEYLLKGICYWTPDTLTNRPNVKGIAPLREEKYPDSENVGSFFQIYGEQGISSHVTSDNKEILIGAPGISYWMGSIIRHRGGSKRIDEYKTEKVNPRKWGRYQSYFGYSVSSGSFDSANKNKTYYISSAPRVAEEWGEVYLFDVLKAPSGDTTIEKFYTFKGNHYAEYYGYVVLAEDINGDGLSDVIVSAPQYSSDGTVEQGAIYVYINKGRFSFELQKKIVSPITGRGRFGTTVTKLGDINHDGFNDIAIGAPFADNGAVFIYLGGPKGLRERPSQKLTSVSTASSWGRHMFGHGLSKGADVDNNGFNDLAVGAPNTEAVFVYRAYPVVKVVATINSLSREIKPEQTKFQVNVCYMISTTSQKVQYQDLAMKISLDPQVKRVTLQQTNSGELAFNATATTQRQCRLLDAMVRFSTPDVFKPIELELHYDLINSVPNSEVFCDKCAAVDPAEPKVYVEKITFSTGCKTDVCIADLKVTSSGPTPTYILGSSRTMSVTYEISNSGETAYLPQINITSSNKMSFAKIPSSCDLHDHVLLCDLYQAQPMGLGSETSLTIVYDVSSIEGKSMTLTAAVFSAGNESNPSNNFVNNVISLLEFTEIEAIGQPHTPHINLEKAFNTAQIVNNYEIKSNGPSRVQELEISFEIPIAYKNRLPIVDINNITLQGMYDQQILPVELYQNNTVILVNAAEIPMSSESEPVTIEWIVDNNHLPADVRRSRRDAEKEASRHDYLKAAQKGPQNQESEELMGSPPINRTIVFNCTDSETTICARAVLKVYNFVPEKLVTITLKYNVNLKEVNDILIDPLKYFVIFQKLDFVKIGDAEGKTVQIKQNLGYNIILRLQVYRVPIWVYMLASSVGLFLLAAMVYGMHKVGFFQRKVKEEMERLVEGQQQPTEELNDKTDNKSTE